MNAERHAEEARDWLAIFKDAETDEERRGALKHAREQIENAEREVGR